MTGLRRFLSINDLFRFVLSDESQLGLTLLPSHFDGLPDLAPVADDASARKTSSAIGLRSQSAGNDSMNP